MLTKSLIKTMALCLGLGMVSDVIQAHTFTPCSTNDLVLDIVLANTNREDDVIDLKGQKFTLTTINNSNNCLPLIQPDTFLGTDHKLTIKNGFLEITMFDSSLNCRFFQVQPNADLKLEDVKLRGGRVISDGSFSPSGGAVYNLGSFNADGVAFIFNTAISAPGVGGAIYNATGASAIIGNSTFNSNSASGAGGAIYNLSTISLLFNSTFYGNSAGFGGAIYNAFSTSKITFMANNTIAGNRADSFGGGIMVSVNNVATQGSIDNFMSNIVAGNSVATGIAANGPDIEDLRSPPGINSANATFDLVQLAGLANGNQIPLSPLNNNVTGVSPMLGPLQNNGGRVFTMAIDSTSPAYNAGDNPLVLYFDGRGPGYLRTRSGQVDIGAYEYQDCIFDAGGDCDGDDVCDDVDSCECVSNPDQTDSDNNGIGDACDTCDDCECREPCDDDDCDHNCPDDGCDGNNDDDNGCGGGGGCDRRRCDRDSHHDRCPHHEDHR